MNNMDDLFNKRNMIIESMGYFNPLILEEKNVILTEGNGNKKSNAYYIVSDKNLDGKTLSPRVPNNFMTKNGFEENKTPRVCASTSIDGCLKGLSRNLKGEVLYIHSIDPSITEKPYKPSIKEVPDSRITNEVWFKKPVKLKCIGKIKVIEDDGKEGEKYTYGNGLVAELYGWKYEWLK